MMTDQTVNRPTNKVLFQLAWSFIWRSIGITTLIYVALALILTGLYYVAFVWCRAPRPIGEAIATYFETIAYVVLTISLALGPVLAFRMMIGKQFGTYRLTLTRTPDSEEEG